MVGDHEALGSSLSTDPAELHKVPLKGHSRKNQAMSTEGICVS